jgi:hypothetical protein
MKLVQFVPWDMSYDLEFSTQERAAKLKAIAHLPPNYLPIKMH